MSTNSMNTCNHSYNNDPTNKKCPTIVLNLIYIIIHLYMSCQLLTSIKIIDFSYLYIFMFIYMCNYAIKMPQI